jgi:hypothetical protein
MVIAEENSMSITVTDPSLLSQLTAGAEVELKDPAGIVLGVFVPKGLGKLPPGVKSPFSDEEMAERRKAAKVGRPLADVLRDIEKRR